MPLPLVVAGIDVGGTRKGFHGVALKDGRYSDQCDSPQAAEIAAWCVRIGAQFIAVDAPCRWNDTGRGRPGERGRPAERALKAIGIQSFLTPTCEQAGNHPKHFYGWMINGAGLFEQIERTYTLYAGASGPPSPSTCLETFPHAVTCAFAGSIVRAKNKRRDRRALLDREGVDTTKLVNIDQVDAAICALTAHQFALGRFEKYGEAVTGFIVVPARTLGS